MQWASPLYMYILQKEKTTWPFVKENYHALNIALYKMYLYLASMKPFYIAQILQLFPFCVTLPYTCMRFSYHGFWQFRTSVKYFNLNSEFSLNLFYGMQEVCTLDHLHERNFNYFAAVVPLYVKINNTVNVQSCTSKL